MKLYELTYLIKPDFSSQDPKDLFQKISSSIQKNGGTLKESKEPIRRGVQTLDFEAMPEKIADIEKELKAEPQIQRYMLLVKVLPKVETKPPRRPLKSKVEPQILQDKIWESKETKTEKKVDEKKIEKKKVELKEIEKKLKEILGE